MSLILPGWTCPCGIFNGEAKAPRGECRSCGLARSPEAREAETDLRPLLRRAVCDFIEPMILSHLTADTEWREEANKFLLQCVPLVFGPSESSFGVKEKHAHEGRAENVVRDWLVAVSRAGTSAMRDAARDLLNEIKWVEAEDEGQTDADVALDSPNFVPQTAKDLAARNFGRTNYADVERRMRADGRETSGAGEASRRDHGTPEASFSYHAPDRGPEESGTNSTSTSACEPGDRFVCGWLECPVHGVPDDGGPVDSPCTPDVGDAWKVFVVRLSENHYRTMFSCAGRHFVLADSEDDEEALVHCVHIRDCFLWALGHVVAGPPPEQVCSHCGLTVDDALGGACAALAGPEHDWVRKVRPDINRRAYLGSQIVQLRARIAGLEKTARKTPPKTLVAERERVAQARVALDAARMRLPQLEEEHARLREAEVPS